MRMLSSTSFHEHFLSGKVLTDHDHLSSKVHNIGHLRRTLGHRFNAFILPSSQCPSHKGAFPCKARNQFSGRVHAGR